MSTAWIREFEARDGETVIRVREWGDPAGPGVIFHHGTPSSSAAVPGGWGAALNAGVRLFSFDRPGYGNSPRQADRTVAHAARWSAAIADTVGMDRFAVVGTSGGGPLAAATAALLPDRITRVAIDVGIGPVTLAGFDPTHGMVAETAAEIYAARNGERALRSYLDGLGESTHSLDAWIKALPLSDREVLDRADVQHEEEQEAHEWSKQGNDGWVDDDLSLFGADWGFDPASISAPTLLLYGGADILVPSAHGEAWARAVPGAELIVVPGAGHWMRDSETWLLGWLGGRSATALIASL